MSFSEKLVGDRRCFRTEDRCGINLRSNGVGERIQGRLLVFSQGGLKRDIIRDELDILHRGDEFPHDLSARRGPAAVFVDSDFERLKVVGGEVVG